MKKNTPNNGKRLVQLIRAGICTWWQSLELLWIKTKVEIILSLFCINLRWTSSSYYSGNWTWNLDLCVLNWRLAPLNRFKPSSKIFYWPFQGGTSFVDLLCFCSVLCLLCFVRVCLYVLRGHLLGKGWPLGSRLWCILWVCHFPIGILGQVWYLIVSIPDLCNLTYFT